VRERLRLSGAAAGRLVRLAVGLQAGELAETAARLGRGEINVEQAQTITTAVGRLPAHAQARAAGFLTGQAEMLGSVELGRLGERLLEVVAPHDADAREQSALQRAEQRGHRLRELYLSEVDAGRVRVTGWLDREAAATVHAALDPLCRPAGVDDQRSAGQRRADALVEVCQLACAIGDLPDNGGDRPQVVVTIDLDALREQVGAASLDDGALLSAAAVPRIACDAGIIPALLGGRGQILDLGRERRMITGPLRRALILRDGGCAFPGCDRPPRWCHGHHIRSWINGGPTNLGNAVLVCARHHRVIHHDGWTVTINPADGRPEFTPPAWIDPRQIPRRNRYHDRQ
jgi:hypothetical protein